MVPILLYGSENWLLNEGLLTKLEAFQAELGRRILKLSKFHSARAVRIALEWPCMASRILQKKLLYLQKVMEDGDSLSQQFFHILQNRQSPTSSIQLIDGCLFLESHLNLRGLTAEVQASGLSPSDC